MAAKALLGLGSAAVSATTPALIRSLYPPERLGRGLGLYAMIVGIAFTVGPTAASTVLSIAPWPWLFFPSAFLALLAVAMAYQGLPNTERSTRVFDGISAMLCAAMFSSLLFAIAGVAHLGGSVALLALLVCAACGFALQRRESRRDAPVLAFDLFRIPLFSLSAATAVCAFAIQGLVFVVLPFLFQFRLGYSQVEAGFLITPWPATLALMTLVAPCLADHVAPGLLGFVGLVLIALGLVLLAVLPADAGLPGISWRLVLCGVGFGLFQSPNMTVLMSSAPRHRSGSAGGILAAARLLGQSIGAASVAFCLARWPSQGIHAALWTGVAIGVVGSVISLTRLAGWVRHHPG